MLSTIGGWVSRLTGDDPSQPLCSDYQWNVPNEKHWAALDVFTSTGLHIGTGIAGICKTEGIVVCGQIDDTLFVYLDDKSGLQHTPCIMQSKDYSKTQVVLEVEQWGRIEEDPIHRWQFDAKDLYWLHHGTLVPFKKSPIN